MEAIISNLVSRFEKGSLSRRELVRGLAMLAAGGTAASAQEGLNFGAATIDHVSIQVADLKRSSEFYQKMFGFKEVSGEPARNILRLGNTRTLVSLNLEKPIATVDHFAIGIPRYNKEAAVRYFTERGVKPLEGFLVRLEFTDGSARTVDLEPYLHGPIFAPVRDDPHLFRSVRVDPEAGTIVWDNGADIDPVGGDCGQLPGIAG